MSEIQSKLIRKNDQWQSEIKILLDYAKDFQKFTIQFISDGTTLDILSSSRGFLRDNKVNITTKSNIVKTVVNTMGKLSVDCIISYYLNGDLTDHETLTTTLDNIESVINEETTIRKIQIPGKTFLSKIEHIENGSHTSGSPWVLDIQSDDNIHVNIKKAGMSKSLFAFGCNTRNILSSDFIFSISPVQDKVLIPKEICWKYYDEYPTNMLGCFEIIKADLHGIDNIYYKTLISNQIDISDLPRKKDRHIEMFSSPLGAFDTTWWVLDRQSNMPVYAGNK